MVDQFLWWVLAVHGLLCVNAWGDDYVCNKQIECFKNLFLLLLGLRVSMCGVYISTGPLRLAPKLRDEYRIHTPETACLFARKGRIRP